MVLASGCSVSKHRGLNTSWMLCVCASQSVARETVVMEGRGGACAKFNERFNSSEMTLMLKASVPQQQETAVSVKELKGRAVMCRCAAAGLIEQKVLLTHCTYHWRVSPVCLLSVSMYAMWMGEDRCDWRRSEDDLFCFFTEVFLKYSADISADVQRINTSQLQCKTKPVFAGFIWTQQIFFDLDDLKKCLFLPPPPPLRTPLFWFLSCPALLNLLPSSVLVLHSPPPPPPSLLYFTV